MPLQGESSRCRIRSSSLDGSLCWKADFPAEEQFVGRVSGWRRLFAQGSTDHRGTPAAPGLVATLLTDEQCESLRLRTPGEPASTCCGVCYRVGEADVEGVLGNLDFREKGGYTRDIVEVTPSEPGRPQIVGFVPPRLAPKAPCVWYAGGTARGDSTEAKIV